MADPAFLLGSNICIYVLSDGEGAAATRLRALQPGSVVASSISCAEVLYGLPTRDAAVRQAVDRFFTAVPVVPFDQAAPAAYLDVPFHRGRFDRLIAAHALALGLVLVTNTMADVADVPGLRTEDWTIPA